MNRREALKNVALLMGGTIIGSQTFLSCVFDSRKTDTDTDLYTFADIAVMSELGETIIPTTDTPGAKSAKVGEFMAVMLRDCYSEEHRDLVKKGLQEIQANFQEKNGIPFEDGTSEQRNNFVRNLEQQTAFYYQNSTEEDPEHYYRLLKEMTLLGYFTSEIGCTQALSYVQTPGRYDACVPYTKGDKAWI